MILRSVNAYIQKHQLLLPNSKVVVGVSGGADSVVLLHLLNSLGFLCVVAHCNFQLRGEESDRDEEFVRLLAQEKKMPLHVVTFDTKKYAAQNKISIEMAARELRYGWFESVRKEEKADAVAVAHHADDSIETLLLNLVRGTGLRGLTGISPKNGYVIRPLLNCSRNDILNYCFQNQLNYVTDSTNAFNDYNRNKIRNKVIPLLEEINPSVRATLYQELDRLEGTYRVFASAVDSARKEVTSEKNGVLHIDISKLRQTADLSVMLYELLQPYGFLSPVIEQVANSLDAESGKQFYSATYRLVKDRDFLLISEISKETNEEYFIDVQDKQICSPIKMNMELFERKDSFQIPREQDVAVFDADKLIFPLTLRLWKEGDSFVPFGMKSSKKLSDYFIDKKISRIEKEKTYLLLSDGNIIWVVGQRTDDRYKITNKTKNILKITLQK